MCSLAQLRSLLGRWVCTRRGEVVVAVEFLEEDAPPGMLLRVSRLIVHWETCRGCRRESLGGASGFLLLCSVGFEE
jgi:hypothetical protein